MNIPFRSWPARLGQIGAGLVLAAAATAAAQLPPLDYRIQLDTLSSGFDRRTCWMHPRAGAIPGPRPVVVLTMQKALLTASDVYYALNELRTDDLGANWTGPIEQPTLGRKTDAKGMVSCIVDFTPQWNPGARRILGTGTDTYFWREKRVNDEPMRAAYAVYDDSRRTWSPWQRVAMPEEARFYAVSAGCGQRLDRADGTVLLPVYFKPKGVVPYSVTVLRCSFDGTELVYRDHGDALTLPFDPATIPSSLPYERQTFLARQLGFFEPSLTFFQGRYFLTLRNVKDNYVTVGSDGLHFRAARRWKFDDGADLGSEDTQTHWVTHTDGLFLTYTRRGAGNDRVFRHRAPIFIARVDPERLVLLRATERILVPEHGAAEGNFGVVNVNERETWVTTSESMQGTGKNIGDYAEPQRYGADNRVYAARIIWNRSNRANGSVP